MILSALAAALFAAEPPMPAITPSPASPAPGAAGSATRVSPRSPPNRAVRAGVAAPSLQLARRIAGEIVPADFPAAPPDAPMRRQVVLRYLIGVEGRVTACSVSFSSGDRDLDNRICLVVTERYRFQPARDADGNAVPETRIEVVAPPAPAPRASHMLPRPPPPLPPPAPAPLPPPAPRAIDSDLQSYLAIRGARPARLHTGYIRDDDYPATSLRHEEQGRVVVRFLVASDGRVADCAIEQSSGFAALDGVTCMLVLRRFTYFPAHDEAGNPIETERTLGVSWRLPVDSPPPVPPPVPDDQ
jgi:TonB family protein